MLLLINFKKKNSQKTFTCPSGKWRINSTSQTTKFTSPGLSDLNFFVPCVYMEFIMSFPLKLATSFNTNKLDFTSVCTTHSFCHITHVCIKRKTLTWYFSAIAFGTLPGLGASLCLMVLVDSILYRVSCSVSKAFASFSSLFSARRWCHWEQSNSGFLLGHLLAVGIVGRDLGLFMPTAGWLGVPVLGRTEIKVVASATSMSSAKSKPLSFRTDKCKIDIYLCEVLSSPCSIY